MHPWFGTLKRLLLPVIVLLAALRPGTAAALQEPDTAAAPLPDYDIRKTSAAPALPQVRRLAVLPIQQAALDALFTRAPDARLRWSGFTAAPNRLLGMARPLTAASLAPPREVAFAFLRENRDLFLLGETDIADLAVSREVLSSQSGVTHLTMQQQVNGLPLFGAQMTGNVDRDGRLLSMAGELLPNPAAHANAAAPQVDAEDAARLALQNARIRAPRSVRQGLVYFPMSPTEVRLARDLYVEDGESSNGYRILVDAVDGTLLWRQSLTFYAAPHGEVYTRESPVPNVPIGAAGGEVPRDDVGFDGGLFFAPGDAHHDWWNDSTGAADAATTKSNNTHAKEDTDGDNDDTEGFVPAVTDGDFTFPIDLTQVPSTYLSASTVNLFHWLNRLHDLFYVYGFDEAAGNYQSDNFGLGGVGDDPLQGDTQDPKENCNAHTGWTVYCDDVTKICTSGDGVSTRIQTGICGNNDLGLENQAITHEWGHAVHARLVPSLAGAQQMGEGWADFFAIAAFAEPADDLFGSYPIASWSFSKPNGIRRQPYSVDQSVFTRTYANINDATFCAKKTCSNDSSQVCDKDADCGAGNTCGRTSCSFQSECEPPDTSISQGPCIPSVYHAGELWTESLWLARANLVWKNGFSSGDRQMMELVIDGMKLAPPYPDFLDARDAILLGDTARSGGANVCALWDGFARMGLGNSASTSGPDDINPVEAFDLPPECVPAIEVTADRSFADVCPGQTATHPLTIGNTDDAADLIVRSVAVASGSPEITVDSTPVTPRFVAAGAGETFTVRYAPPACGSSSTVVRIESNDPAEPVVDLAYSGSTDAVPPTITFCPGDTVVECDQSTEPPHTGTATAADSCSTPVVSFSDLVAPVGACPEQKIITRTWQAVDGCGNASSCQQVITVQDTTPPVISCNAPATITPPDAPIDFTASAVDNCDAEPSVVVTGYGCHMTARNGKVIDKKASCEVRYDGAVVTILDSGGVGDVITWNVRSTDCSGNESQQVCSVTVVNPAK